MTKSESNDYCIDCGEPLEFYPTDQPRPPCPKCKSTKRKRNVVINEKITIKNGIKTHAEGSTTKTNYPILILAFTLTLVSAFGSSFVIGYWSIAVGLAVGFVAFYVGFYVREKHTWTKDYEKS